MTQPLDASPGRSQAAPRAAGPGAAVPGSDAAGSAAAGANVPATARGPGVRTRAWLLLCLPFGVTTWAAFLYIGIRARRPRWLVWAGVYAGMFAGFAALENPAHPSETAKSVALCLLLAAWIGGGTHAIAVSGDAVRRIHRGRDPAMEAAQDRIDRRAEGRHLLASRPALAREIGVGRPDLPGGSDYGLVDVNHASAAALTRLPGITQQLADRIVGQRAQVGGFTSAEDLGVLLDLSPDIVDGLRDMAIFPPG